MVNRRFYRLCNFTGHPLETVAGPFRFSCGSELQFISSDFRLVTANFAAHALKSSRRHRVPPSKEEFIHKFILTIISGLLHAKEITRPHDCVGLIVAHEFGLYLDHFFISECRPILKNL